MVLAVLIPKNSGQLLVALIGLNNSLYMLALILNLQMHLVATFRCSHIGMPPWLKWRISRIRFACLVKAEYVLSNQMLPFAGHLYCQSLPASGSVYAQKVIYSESQTSAPCLIFILANTSLAVVDVWLLLCSSLDFLELHFAAFSPKAEDLLLRQAKALLSNESF